MTEVWFGFLDWTRCSVPRIALERRWPRLWEVLGIAICRGTYALPIAPLMQVANEGSTEKAD